MNESRAGWRGLFVVGLLACSSGEAATTGNAAGGDGPSTTTGGGGAGAAIGGVANGGGAVGGSPGAGGEGACASGTADCNGDVSDGCEVDLVTDPDHCGECGQSCLGAACEESLCAAIVLTEDAFNVTSMLVDDTDVYWIGDGGDTSLDPMVWRLDKELGGAPAMIGGTFLGPAFFKEMDQTSTDIYWVDRDVDDHHIARASKAGGPSEWVPGGPESAIAMAVDETAMTWFTPSGPGIGVYTRPLGGGLVAELPTQDFVGINAIVQDATHWYVGSTFPDAAGNTILRYPKSSPTVAQPVAGGAAPGVEEGNAMVVTGDEVWWLAVGSVGAADCIQNSALWSVPKAGGAPVSKASGLGWPRFIVADDEDVYWVGCTGTHENRVFRLSKSGGVPTVIASAGDDVHQIAIDDAFVYFATSVDGIQKIAK